MGRALPAGLVLGIFVSGAAGCAASVPPPFTREFYSAPKVTALSTPLPPVFVHRFADERPGAVDPMLVYRFDSISGAVGETALSKSFNAVRATEPVAVGVAQAILEALRARGLGVIDMTATPFAPGLGPGAPRRGVSGRVLAFGVQVVRSGVYEYRSIIGCKIALAAYDVESGRMLWEKTYAWQEEATSRTLASAAPGNQWPGLSRVLAVVVDEVVNDPALFEALRSP